MSVIWGIKTEKITHTVQQHSKNPLNKITTNYAKQVVCTVNLNLTRLHHFNLVKKIIINLMIRPYLSLVSYILSEFFGWGFQWIGIIFIQSSLVFRSHRVVCWIGNDWIIRFFRFNRGWTTVISEWCVRVFIQKSSCRLAIRNTLVALFRRGSVKRIAILVN